MPNESASASAALIPRKRAAWLAPALAFNVPFLLALAGVQLLPQFFQPLVVCAILFLAPGAAWTDWRKRDAVTTLFRIVLISLAASVAALLVLIPFPGPTSRIGLIAILAVVANAGVFYGAQRGWFSAPGLARPLPIALSIVAALFYVQSFLGAAYFVPALEDQDMETQGTAYGIVNAASPTMATNRDTTYFFAHPLLLHVWIGESALISGDIDRLKHYHDASLAAQAANAKSTTPFWQTSFDQFNADPVLLPTRTPNLGLAFLIVFPLGLLIYRLSGSTIAAVGGAVLYATMPEIYVRSSYGGYLAVTNFLLVCGAWFYLNAAGLLPQRDGMTTQRTGRFAFGGAFLAGMSDQKGVLLPMAAPVHAGLSFLFSGGFSNFIARLRQRPEIAAAFLVGTGFVCGWLVFVLWGALTNWQQFYFDHIWSHIKERLVLRDLELTDQTAWYPTIAGLWRQFGDHYGWLIIAASVAGGVYAVTRFKQAEGYFLVWMLIGAVGFSLVDWRQTKHLAHIVPAMVVLSAVWWGSLQGRMRLVVGALLAAAIAWNMWRVGLQMQDFEYIKPLPIW